MLGTESAGAVPRMLVWMWSEPDKPSGSPAIMAELLRRVPAGRAEVVCEDQTPPEKRRDVRLPHPVRRLRTHRYTWPFSRGDRVRRVTRYLDVPALLATGWWRIRSFEPDCLVHVVFEDRWILTAYLLSRATGTPLVIYAHDPYLELARKHGGLERRLAEWLEPRLMGHAHVAALYGSLRDVYRERYGRDSVVVRNIAASKRRPRRAGGKRIIGFAGAIYDNNAELLEQLGRAVDADERLELRLWTSATPERLAALGLSGPRVSVRFESNYEKLLDALGGCDLLYLPLTFHDTPSMPRASLEVVLPTKCVDYLLAGPDILVHAPADYEMSRFFEEHGAGHLLRDDGPRALADWLGRWAEGAVPELAEERVEAAVAEFDPERNWDRFLQVLKAATSEGA
jgi:glycosyltransferase involved in cell wall biosynthesis